MGKYTYETVTGLFHQSTSSIDSSTFDYTNNFGLIATSPTAWSDLISTLEDLNSSAPPSTSYKFLYLARHGEGYHNVAEARFGTPAWDAHYSLLDSYEDMIFADARLTPTGKAQAQLAGRTFRSAWGRGMPRPQQYRCSPLSRCLETCDLTFAGPDRPFVLVVEGFREAIGEHTCDRRSTRSEIEGEWGDRFVFEEGFTEEDRLWTKDERESNEKLDARLRSALDGLWQGKGGDAVYWSITTHSGAIGALLRVLGHKPFGPQTGSVLPVVVKVVRHD